jgi:hypothetical protein
MDMDVVIDGARGYTFDEEPADVFEAVARIVGALQHKGRALLAVTADGKDIAPDCLREALVGKPLAAVGTLEIRSGEVAALVAESLAELEATAPDLPQACRELARVFQGTDPEQGYEPFQRLAELWGHVKARQKLVATALTVHLDDLQVDGKTFLSLHDDLNEMLEEAARALECSDLILLGDLLEYELAPRAETEMKIVARLKECSQLRAG